MDGDLAAVSRLPGRVYQLQGDGSASGQVDDPSEGAAAAGLRWEGNQVGRSRVSTLDDGEEDVPRGSIGPVDGGGLAAGRWVCGGQARQGKAKRRYTTVS